MAAIVCSTAYAGDPNLPQNPTAKATVTRIAAAAASFIGLFMANLHSLR
jgi:hypothetical protein